MANLATIIRDLRSEQMTLVKASMCEDNDDKLKLNLRVAILFHEVTTKLEKIVELTVPFDVDKTAIAAVQQTIANRIEEKDFERRSAAGIPATVKQAEAKFIKAESRTMRDTAWPEAKVV